MQKRLAQLGDQLDAIHRALDIARRETDPERRERWLKAVEHAAAAADEEHQAAAAEDARRPALRILKGGAAGAAAAVACAWVCENPLRTGSTTVALAAAAVLWTAGPADDPERHLTGPPVPRPSVSTPHIAHPPPASRADARSERDTTRVETHAEGTGAAVIPEAPGPEPARPDDTTAPGPPRPPEDDPDGPDGDLPGGNGDPDPPETPTVEAEDDGLCLHLAVRPILKARICATHGTG